MKLVGWAREEQWDDVAELLSQDRADAWHNAAAPEIETYRQEIAHRKQLLAILSGLINGRLRFHRQD